MQAWLAQAIARRPGLFLLANLAVAGLAGVLALGAVDRLVVAGGLERAGVPAQTVELSLTARGAVSDAVADEALAVITSGVLADPAVSAVTTGKRGRGGDVVMTVGVASPTAAGRQEAAERVADQVDPGPFRVEAAGEAQVLRDARESVAEEVPRLALLAAPLVVLVLGFAFGPRLAPAPALAAATAGLGGVAVLRLLPDALDLTAAGIAVAAAVGLAIAVEVCFTVRAAHRAARFDAQGAMLEEALRGALPGVIWSCLGAAVASAAVIAIPLASARSAAIGGIAAASLAALSAPIATASMIALVPPRAPGSSQVGPGSVGERIRAGRVGALADEIAIRPALGWIPALAVLAGLGALTYPAFDAEAIALDGPADAAAEVIRTRLAWILGAITGAGLLTAYLATRSVRLAVARGIGAALPAGAACGVLVLAAEGELPAPAAVGGAPYASTLLVVVAAVGAVAVARGALADRRGALAGTLVAGAGLGVLAGLELDAVAQLGLAIAVGLAIDLLLVRGVLVPCLEHAVPHGAPGLPRPRLPHLARPRLPDRFRR